MPTLDFRSNPRLVLIYQVAETIGETAEYVKENLSSQELAEWGAYFNTPFSRTGRDLFLNAWLVQIIRSIMATKTNRPKFKDSLFPLSKFQDEYFAPYRKEMASKKAKEARESYRRSRTRNSKGDKDGRKKLKTPGEVMHRMHILRKRVEKAQADYMAGKTVNRFGYYIHETMY